MPVIAGTANDPVTGRAMKRHRDRLFANTVPGSADTGVGSTGVRLCVPDDVDWNLPPLQIPIEKIRPAELTPGGPAT